MNGKIAYGHQCNGIFFIAMSYTHTHTQNIYSTTPCENANFIYIKKIEKLQ